MYYSYYSSIIGELVLVSDGINLLYLSNKKYSEDCVVNDNLDIFIDTKKWLDSYFSGRDSDIVINYKISGSDFRKRVLDIVSSIRFGNTMTYKEIANIIAEERGLKSMSSQAVGNAIASNPLLLIIPCHRVISSDGKLTGYSGGLLNKKKLLEFESSVCYGKNK